MQHPETFSIGGVRVGAGVPCFVVGEAGVNHDGDPDLAHALIDIAADCGADAVKFQTFEPDAVAAPAAPTAPYQSRDSATSQLELLRALALPRTAWRDLVDHARDRGLVFLSTAFDRASLQLLLDLEVPALKSPSGEIDNLPFLAELAAANRPIILSTGASNLDEVEVAVEAVAAAPALCLLHCVTAYPCPIEESNLRAIMTLSSRFRIPVGWSDHTAGSVTGIAAVALGAAVLEKHFTLDRGLSGPDHRASSCPPDFAAYISGVRETEAALGTGEKRPTDAEEENLPLIRRSYHARRDLEPGHVLSDEDVALLRPAHGLTSRQPVVGRRLVRRVPAGQPITVEDLQ